MQIVGGLGGLLFLIGWIWLIVIAFQTSGTLWGILNIFFQPVMGIIYALVKKVGWLQVGLMIVGFILAGVGMGSSIAALLTP
jgi:hypothetical protein